MSMPICPRCGSGNVIPSAESAGHNRCINCQYYAAVVNFHTERDPRGRYTAPVKTILAEQQRGNQTHRRRGRSPVINGKRQRPATQIQFWWERD